MKFRKKPVVVEAVQVFQKDFDEEFEIQKEIHKEEMEAKGEYSGGLTGCMGKIKGYPVYLHKHCFKGERPIRKQIQAFVYTLEGKMQILSGDWIIKGVNGEFYPCKPDIFEKTYEPVEDITVRNGFGEKI